jgi:hypothetical protein
MADHADADLVGAVVAVQEQGAAMIKKPHSSGGGEPWGKFFFGGSEEGCIGPAAAQIFGAPGSLPQQPFNGYQDNRSSKRNKRGLSSKGSSDHIIGSGYS